jgi:hypothetical protein
MLVDEDGVVIVIDRCNSLALVEDDGLDDDPL